MTKKRTAIAIIVFMNVAITVAEAADIPGGGIYQNSGTQYYVSSADATINAPGGDEGIYLGNGSTADITIDDGDGTLTINKSGSWSAIQINGNPGDTRQNNLAIHGNLVIHSESRSFDSTGDIHGIGDANLTVSGNLAIDRTYDQGRNVSAANLLFEGGSVRVDGNTDLSIRAINSGTARYTGLLAGVYAAQGNSSHPATNMTFGTDASSTFRIHDVHLTSTSQHAEAYGIKVNTDSVTNPTPTHESHVIVNSNAVIENVKAVAHADYAYAAGVEADESASIEFRSGLVVRNIAAIAGNDIPELTSGTSGSDAEAYSLVALNGGQIEVNATQNTAYTVQIEGDMVSVDTDENRESRINASFMNDQSWFRGLTNDPYGVGTGKIDLTFANNASWIVPDDNALRGTLDLQNGRVYVGSTPDMFSSTGHNGAAVLNDAKTLTLDNLTGSGGTFYLRADIANDTADQVVVKQGTGQHYLMVRSTGAEPSQDRMNTYLTRLEQGDANFRLANPSGNVDAGVYFYELAQRTSGEVAGATEWFLQRTKEKTPTTEAVLGLSGVAASYAMVYGQLSDLRERLGEIRHGSGTDGIWARTFAERNKLDGLAGTDFSQHLYGFSLGVDRLWRQNEENEWLFGLRGQYTSASQDMDGRFGGDGNAHSYGLAAYATWKHASGWYTDTVATWDQFRQDIDTHMTDGTPVSGDFRSHGAGISFETGRYIPVGDGMFVEPQAQLAYYRLKGADFTMSNGMKVKHDDVDSLTTRLGLVFGRLWKMNDGRFAQPYLKVGVIHEFMGDQDARVNGEAFSGSLDGSRVYYGGGLDWQIGKLSRFYGEIERENGEHVSRPWSVSAGVRIAF